MTAVVAVAAALVAAGVVALIRMRRTGRVRPVHRAEEPLLPAYADGSTVTLLQFSTRVCAPCVSTRRVLADVAASMAGVRHVEIDVEGSLDLARQLQVRRAPTSFVVAPDGAVRRRVSGVPRREELVAAVKAVAGG